MRTELDHWDKLLVQMFEDMVREGTMERAGTQNGQRAYKLTELGKKIGPKLDQNKASGEKGLN
jgi:hypothetical protein